MEVHFCDKSHLDPRRERFPAFDNEGRCAHCEKVVDDETIRNTVSVHLEIHDEIIRQNKIKAACHPLIVVPELDMRVRVVDGMLYLYFPQTHMGGPFTPIILRDGERIDLSAKDGHLVLVRMLSETRACRPAE